MAETGNDKSKTGGVIAKSALYAYASKYSKEAIDTLYDLMKNAKQESVRVSAASKLLDKTLADVKSVELTGQDGQPFTLNIIGGGYIPTVTSTGAASATGHILAATVQNTDMAQAGAQDDDSDNGDNTASTS